MIYLRGRRTIPGQRHPAKMAWIGDCDLGILREFHGRPKRQDNPASLEERHAVSSPRLAAEAKCLIERRALAKIADAKRHQRQTCSRFTHVRTSSAAHSHCAAARNARLSASPASC